MKLRIDGVPLHALLVHFPVAGWTAASLLAAVSLAGYPGLAELALYCNAAALLLGLPTIGAGFAEFVLLPADAGIRERGAQHMLFAVGAWSAYLVMLLLQAKQLTLAAAVTGGVALLLLIAAGHAGARLVFHDRIPWHG